MKSDTQKKQFLAGFDYGGGALWGFVLAPSIRAIREKYPRLDVFESIPDFVEPFVDDLRKHNVYDIDDPPSGMLAVSMED